MDSLQRNLWRSSNFFDTVVEYNELLYYACLGKFISRFPILGKLFGKVR